MTTEESDVVAEGNDARALHMTIVAGSNISIVQTVMRVQLYLSGADFLSGNLQSESTSVVVAEPVHMVPQSVK